ncbi:MAG TPA: MBL fold metallo-hydrolase [Oligoflexia bacterium]|nr:MBL fold metallo-hydrolase [Oligoflexia bacterium]HMR25289.1 MBL fold metallo-hydrolase [Oligoflexia bacterium]
MNNNPIFFKQFEIGPMANFIYLIGDPKTRTAAVVDPAWDVDAIIKLAEQEGYQISDILITHGHPDHINGVEDMIAKTGAKVHMHKDEMPWLGEFKETAIKTDNETIINVGQIPIRCIHTPGHTPGSQCFMVDERLVSGDTLFIGGCGRTDLPGGDAEKLYESLYHRLSKVDDEVILCPGHNYADVKQRKMREEKKDNPYLQFETVQAFIGQRDPFASQEDE